MPRKIKHTSFVGELYISQQSYNQLLAWAQSFNEINFICFGQGRNIKEVVRLSNTSRFPRKFANWHEEVSKTIIRTKQDEGLKALCWGHSHPYKQNDKHPSVIDIEVIKKGNIELIVFPTCNKIRAWKIAKNLKETLESEIILNCLLG